MSVYNHPPCPGKIASWAARALFSAPGRGERSRFGFVQSSRVGLVRYDRVGIVQSNRLGGNHLGVISKPSKQLPFTTQPPRGCKEVAS